MARINPVIIAAVCLFLVPGIVSAIPGIPNQFYGKVVYNNSQPAEDGLEVAAKIDGTTVATALTSGGWYSVIVTDPKNNRAGDTIHFFASGTDTGESGVFQTGLVTPVDLTLPFGPPPVYEPPVVQPPTQTSGAGGGSSSSAVGGSTAGTANATNQTGAVTPAPVTTPPACEENWSCTGWGECSGNVSARTCTDENSCGTDINKPFDTQPCSYEDMTRAQTAPTGFFAFSKTSTILGIILALALISGLLFRKKIFGRAASAPQAPPAAAQNIPPEAGTPADSGTASDSAKNEGENQG